MYKYVLLVGAFVSSEASMYSMPEISSQQELLISDINDMLLRDLLEQVRSSNMAEEPDSYLDSRESMLPDKEIPPRDYGAGLDALGPKTSIRDQEYLQHSSLWAHQQLNNYKTNDRHRTKPGTPAAPAAPAKTAVKATAKGDKTENQLPAYCTPPNPCPVGYTAENHCIEDFENTSEFSRDYQSAQDCMCDSEHMMECPNGSEMDNTIVPGMPISNADLDQIVERFQEENPFFRGEKLPIAAKKGINVGF